MMFDMQTYKKEYQKEYQKEYYIKNIEKFREYYHDNKDSIAAYEKLYYHTINRTKRKLEKDKAHIFITITY